MDRLDTASYQAGMTLTRILANPYIHADDRAAFETARTALEDRARLLDEVAQLRQRLGETA